MQEFEGIIKGRPANARSNSHLFSMSLFFMGIIEMVVISLWTRFVSESKIVASGLTSIVNIFIWYYVLQAVTTDIANLSLVMLYAFGCAVGTMATTGLFRFFEQKTSLEA